MKRKGGQSDLRPSRYGSTSSTSFRPRVRVLDGNVAPVDFGAEQDNLFEPIGESVIASQAGKYDNDFIGAFGNVKSTAPIQPVINSGEHQATTRHIPASHYYEGENSVPATIDMDTLMNTLGVDEETRQAINQSEVYQDGGVDTYAPANEDEDDEELMDIFGKLGVSDDYGKYFSGDKAGKGMNMGYTY
tara:strand:- start:2890 stop:3456 length:567 start_codon:yes stop_codon:yes gene_type:complete